MSPTAVSSKNGNGNGNGTKARAQIHAASSKEAFSTEAAYAAHNYHPLPIVFARAKGTSVWDPVRSLSLTETPRLDIIANRTDRRATITWISCRHTVPSTRAIAIQSL
jgi:hypothetical protein